MRAVIFSGGELGEGSNYIPHSGDYIICADSGYENCLRSGAKPDIVIGDFDSLNDYSGDNIIRFKKEKDETDTLLAVNHALKKGYKKIIIFGALGGREDHAIGNIYLLKKILDFGAEGIIDSGKNKIMLTDKSIRIKKEKDKYLSLLPAFGSVSGLTLKGMKYELDNYFMSPGDTIGLSNEILDEYGDIILEKGYLLIFICSD